MKKAALALLALCGGAALLLYFHTPLLRAYAEFFCTQTARKGADALVVLTGWPETRIPRAAELYRNGYAPRILLTQDKPVSDYAEKLFCSNVQRARALLDLLKVGCEPETVPSLKGGATSTFDEAYDMRAWSLQRQYRRIIIVCDDFQTRRALLAFEKVFRGTGIAVEVAGATNGIFGQDDWWKSDMGISTYILEGIKYLVYRFSDRNAPGIKNT